MSKCRARAEFSGTTTIRVAPFPSTSDWTHTRRFLATFVVARTETIPRSATTVFVVLVLAVAHCLTQCHFGRHRRQPDPVPMHKRRVTSSASDQLSAIGRSRSFCRVRNKKNCETRKAAAANDEN